MCDMMFEMVCDMMCEMVYDIMEALGERNPSGCYVYEYSNNKI